MAITITQNVPELSPAYNDIVITASSNLVASKYKFKYVFDIFSRNDTAGVGPMTYIGRVKQTPNPSNVAMLDLSRYLENQVVTALLRDGDGTISTSNTLTIGTIASYVVYCGEEYSDTPTGAVVLYNGDGTAVTGATITSVATITGNTWNAVKQFEEGPTWDAAPFIAATGRRLLTNCPKTIYKDTDEYFIASTLYGTYSGTTFGITGATYAEVYDKSNTLLTTYNPSSGTTFNTTFIRQAFSSNNISTIVSGYTNTWDKIVIRIGGQTESLTIMNKGCAWDKYDPKDVVFLNRLGGWDIFRFYGSKEEVVKITRGTYEVPYGNWSSTGPWSYIITERGTSNIKTDLTVEGQVMSDFLDRDTVNWLEELLTSPQIYLLDGVTYTPINIKDTSFKNQLRGNVKLRQVSFSYEKSNQTRTQQQ